MTVAAVGAERPLLGTYPGLSCPIGVGGVAVKSSDPTSVVEELNESTSVTEDLSEPTNVFEELCQLVATEVLLCVAETLREVGGDTAGESEANSSASASGIDTAVLGV